MVDATSAERQDGRFRRCERGGVCGVGSGSANGGECIPRRCGRACPCVAGRADHTDGGVGAACGRTQARACRAQAQHGLACSGGAAASGPAGNLCACCCACALRCAAPCGASASADAGPRARRRARASRRITQADGTGRSPARRASSLSDQGQLFHPANLHSGNALEVLRRAAVARSAVGQDSRMPQFVVGTEQSVRACTGFDPTKLHHRPGRTS